MLSNLTDHVRSATRMSEEGRRMLKSFEALELHPYQDQGGVWTIGWGTTQYENGIPVSGHDKPITEERAQQLFDFEVNSKSYVLSEAFKHNGIIVNQNQFDGCILLVYNIGVHQFLTSTVFKRMKKNPFDATIRDAFLMFNKITDPVTKKKFTSSGLTTRRMREARLYFS